MYPIKSCRGVTVDAARIGVRGFELDRRFMLIDAKNRFLTQRLYPKMAQIAVAIVDEARLDISAPGAASLSIPQSPNYGAEEQVRIWRSTVVASIAGEEINAWFSAVMGFSVRLAYLRDDQHRAVSNASAAFDDEVGFADDAPILLIGEGSLADLNSRLERPVTMQHFRPNIVVDTDQPFIEDHWQRIRISGIELELAWDSARCTITTINPDTAISNPSGEPLETLKAYRRKGRGVMFGRNILIRGRGTIRTGDSIDVIT